MPVPQHLDAAVERLDDAQRRIELARNGPNTPENLRSWLEALSDYVTSLSEVHRFTNESVHEKLHGLSRVLAMQQPPQPAAPPTH